MKDCQNDVSYYIPHGWDYKEVLTRCGTTDVHGERAECGDCQAVRELAGRPPHGYCRHGVYVLTDHDMACSACEFDDD